MHLYAIGDLHLSFSADKPMDIFGPQWADHAAHIERAWRSRISEDDLILIPGDISWAMQLSSALPDLAFIGALPGKKLLLRGNHDYWWSSLTRVRAALPLNTFALQNDAFACGPFAVAGTRGWACPGSSGFTAADGKIYEREVQRLELSLRALPDAGLRVVMTHFPPFCEPAFDTAFTALFERYDVKHVIYAHLHGAAHRLAFEGERNGVRYTLAAADYLKFVPKRIV